MSIKTISEKFSVTDTLATKIIKLWYHSLITGKVLIGPTDFILQLKIKTVNETAVAILKLTALDLGQQEVGLRLSLQIRSLAFVHCTVPAC